MNAGTEDLLDRLAEDRFGGVSDWIQFNKEIVREYNSASSTDRLTLLRAFTILMDGVEKTQIAPESTEEFRSARRQQYLLFLMTDSMENVEEGILSPQKINETVRREISEGRLSAEDDFAKLALAGGLLYGGDVTPPTLAAAEPVKTLDQTKPSGWRTVLRWFGND